MSFEITIEKTQNSRIGQFDPENIGFGKIFTDHMFLANWNGSEWINPRIEPYGPLNLSPATSAIHYGQSIFEGMKAFADKKRVSRYCFVRARTGNASIALLNAW